MTEKPIYQDPDYVQGQIAALQALILGLAQTQTKQEFREQSLTRLEMLKTTLLAQPISDARLHAVESCIDWIRHMTD